VPMVLDHFCMFPSHLS